MLTPRRRLKLLRGRSSKGLASGMRAKGCFRTWYIIMALGSSRFEQGRAGTAGHSGRWAHYSAANSRGIASSICSDLISDEDSREFASTGPTRRQRR